VEEENFKHQLTRDGEKVKKLLWQKGIKSPPLAGAVKVNHNTWIVPKGKATEQWKEKVKAKYSL
jgi:hypothetical protein